MDTVLLTATTRRGWLAIGCVAALLAAAAVIEGSAGGPGTALTGWVVLGAIGTAAACLLAYAVPLAGLALVLAMGVVWVLVPGLPRGGGSQLIALMFLSGYLAYRLPGRWSVAAVAVAAMVPATTLVATGDGEPWEFMFYLLILGTAWAVGFLLARERRRTAQLTRLAAELAAERELRAQAAVAEERTRIAQELHDAVAHSVSVMTLQVGVVRRRLSALPTEQQTLQQAELLGRRSVDELRRIVGLVRPAMGQADALAPVPSLTQLDDLVAQVRAAGTTVTLDWPEPRPAIPGALDMSAYRIVQESLTNALRHASGQPVGVSVRVSDGALVIDVTNLGPSVDPVRPGHGLTGMAERVALFGGRLTYGPGAEGGFRVHAELPLEAAAQAAVAPRPIGADR